MYKNFNLTESEREQILKQHQEKGYRKPLNEQSTNSLNEMDRFDDEEYFGRHSVNHPWTGGKTTFNYTDDRFTDGDYEDESFDDYDMAVEKYPHFGRAYGGVLGDDESRNKYGRQMFDIYKHMHGPLQVRRRKSINRF